MISGGYMVENYGSRSRGTLLDEHAARVGVSAPVENTPKTRRLGKHPLLEKLSREGRAPDPEAYRSAVDDYMKCLAGLVTDRAFGKGFADRKAGGNRPPPDVMLEPLVRMSFPEPIEADIFKPLYLDLMPARLRHDKGEHYTPDWAADRALDMAGYDGDPHSKLLDPACGSGTFLVRAVRRLKKKCAEAGLSATETLRRVVENIAGIDSHGSAASMARANLALAVVDLLDAEKTSPEFNLYRADSLVPGESSPIPGDFFASFDYVVGNPPWVNWESIDEDYRAKTRPLWDYHGLFPHSGMDALLGHSKKDLSMLMTYCAMEKFLRPGGVLSFVITRSAVKSAGSGQGFRRFTLGDGTPVKPVAVEDLTELKPFGASGVPVVVMTLKKGEKVSYPVEYGAWKAKGGKKSGDGAPRLLKLAAEPVDASDPTSAWITAPRKALGPLRKIFGRSHYTAYAGVYSGGANGVYWLRVLGEGRGGLVKVENLPGAGKREIDRVEAWLERDLLYPLVRSGEIGRWRYSSELAVLVVQDPVRRRGIDESTLESDYPHTYRYLRRFDQLLRERAAWRRFFTVKRGGEPVEKAPFYSMFAVGAYTFAPFKVAWPRMASGLAAAVLEPRDSKPALPQETITFVPCSSRREAHYVCGMINSKPVNHAARAYSQVGGKGFASPHILKYIRIPAYEPGNPLHEQIADLSMKAHAQAPEDGKLQEEADRRAAEVFGVGHDAFRDRFPPDF